MEDIFYKFNMILILVLSIIGYKYLKQLVKLINKFFVFIAVKYINQVLEDEELNNKVKYQLNLILTDKQVNETLCTTLKSQLNNVIIDENINKSIKEKILELAHDHKIEMAITNIVQTQLESTESTPRTKKAIANLLKTQTEEAVQQEWFRTEIRDQIVTFCKSDPIQEQVANMIRGVGKDLSESEETNRIINDFLLKLVNDKEFLKQAGCAIRRSLKHATYGLFWNYNKEEKESL